MRDLKTMRELAARRWRLLVVWECALAARLVDQTASKAADWLLSPQLPDLCCIEPALIAEKTVPSPQLREIFLPTSD